MRKTNWAPLGFGLGAAGLLVLAGLALRERSAARTAGRSVPAAAGRPGGASEGAGAEITFLYPVREDEEKPLAQLLRLFERDHPDIRVRLEVHPGGPIHQAIGKGIAAGDAPDVFWFEDEPFEEFAQAGAFLPLDAYIGRDRYDVEDFFPLAQSEFMHRGVTYGFSQGWGVMLLFLNKEILEERKVVYSDDWSWNEFEEAARRLTFDRDGDGDIDVYGFQGQRYFGHACTWIWSAGGEVLNEDRSRFTLRDPTVVRAFERWCNLYRREDPITPVQGDARDPAFGTLANPFFEGRAAMLESGPYFCNALRGNTRFRWEIGYLPKCPDGPGGRPHRRTRLYGDGYAIWDRRPPHAMARQGLLDRAVLSAISPGVRERLAGTKDLSGLDDGALSKALASRASGVSAPELAAELLRIWGDPAGRAAMNPKLKAEMARRDAAFELLKHIAGPAGQRLVARLGRSVPGRRSVALSREFNRPDTPYDETRMVQAIEFAHLQPITRDFGAVQEVFAKYTDRVFLRGDGIFKKLSPREALEQMEAELNLILARKE